MFVRASDIDAVEYSVVHSTARAHECLQFGKQHQQ